MKFTSATALFAALIAVFIGNTHACFFGHCPDVEVDCCLGIIYVGYLGQFEDHECEPFCGSPRVTTTCKEAFPAECGSGFCSEVAQEYNYACGNRDSNLRGTRDGDKGPAMVTAMVPEQGEDQSDKKVNSI